MTVTNITESMATLDWNTLSTPVTGWEVEYGPYGFTHGNGTTLTLSDSTATLTGLDANTTYTAYVRSDCGGGEFSNWISVTFSTACGTVTPPYFQDYPGGCPQVQKSHPSGLRKSETEQGRLLRGGHLQL